MTPGEMQKRLIERTKNPLAPILLQDVAVSVKKLHMMLLLEQGSTEAKAKEITGKLMSGFKSDEELDSFAKTPDFLSALCLMIYAATQEYILAKTQDLPN